MSRKDIAGAGADIAFDVVMRKLTALALMQGDERSAQNAYVQSRLGPIERWIRGTILGPLQHAPAMRVLVSGWAVKQTVAKDGRRQIVGFLLPGDFIGTEEDRSWAPHCEIETLTTATTVCARRLLSAEGHDRARRDALTAALAQHNHAGALHQILRLGAPTAHERMAGLFLELHARLDAMGLVRDGGFHCPLTHEQLADATGLSAVHVNRVLQDLRRRGFIDLDRRMLKLRRADLLALARNGPCPQAASLRPLVSPVQLGGATHHYDVVEAFAAPS